MCAMPRFPCREGGTIHRSIVGAASCCWLAEVARPIPPALLPSREDLPPGPPLPAPPAMSPSRRGGPFGRASRPAFGDSDSLPNGGVFRASGGARRHAGHRTRHL